MGRRARRPRRWTTVASGSSERRGHRLRRHRPEHGALGARHLHAAARHRRARRSRRLRRTRTRTSSRCGSRSTGDGIPTPGIDRRVFTSAEDPTLRTGFPKRMGTGGEAPIRYADLNGDNMQELIVPTEDGKVHAYEPDGSELPGWPVQTEIENAADGHALGARVHAAGRRHAAARAAARRRRRRPRRRRPAGGDRHRRHSTSTSGSPTASCARASRSARTRLLRSGRTRASRSTTRSAASSRAPRSGASRAPDKPLDIVVPSLDGHLYAFDGDGNALSGLPGPAQSTAPSRRTSG